MEEGNNEIQMHQINQSHRPLESESRVYIKTNAYSHMPSRQQIIAVILFLAQFTIHCVCLIRPLLAIDHSVLYLLWGIMWALLAVILFDYFVLTCGDPADRLLINPDSLNQWKAKEIEYSCRHQAGTANPYEVTVCIFCQMIVQKSSYHCWSCQRCVQNLDHHCKYLNNCISHRNYTQFFRLLCCLSLYLMGSIAVGLWVFSLAFTLPRIDELAFSRWWGLVYAVASLTYLVGVQILLWFHCYISCYLKVTTLEYLSKERRQQVEVQQIGQSKQKSTNHMTSPAPP